MKRIVLFLLMIVMLFSFCGCSSVSSEDAESTLDQFVKALKVYDKTAMSEHLTAFPDNSAYVYLDDIFNDTGYMELYRLLYGDLSYEIKSYEDDQMVVSFTMPNVQKLYTDVSGLVLSLAMSDTTLQEKLAENDENGIVLIREMMLSLAAQNKGIEQMTEDFILTFKNGGEKALILCDDELKALMTGNFFLSKNTTLESIESDIGE